MSFVHYLNGTLYLINSLLWALYADKPLFAVVWLLTGLGSLWIGRETAR